jgi:hypothetical protein
MPLSEIRMDTRKICAINTRPIAGKNLFIQSLKLEIKKAHHASNSIKMQAFHL